MSGAERDGRRNSMGSPKGAKPKTKLEEVGPAPKGRRGTTVSFWPDPTVFEEVEFRSQSVVEHLQMYAFLNAGLEIRFQDERPGHEQEVIYKYPGGIIDYARHL